MSNDARVSELVERFIEANNELIYIMEGCSDEQGQTMSEHEGRTVSVLARHVAVSHLGILGWVRALTTGEPLPELTMDMVHGVNANQVEEWTALDSAETIRLLRENGRAVVETLRGLTDEDLDRSAPFSLYGGQVVTAQQVAEDILVGHVEGHLGSVRAALGAN